MYVCVCVCVWRMSVRMCVKDEILCVLVQYECMACTVEILECVKHIIIRASFFQLLIIILLRTGMLLHVHVTSLYIL